MTQDMARGKRKVREGIVISCKSPKTVVVRVERKYRHPVYDKVIMMAKKYHAHDEKAEELKEGDKVVIAECRPISKLKRWRVVRES